MYEESQMNLDRSERSGYLQTINGSGLQNKPSSPVMREYGELGECIGKLETVVEQLTEALLPILGPNNAVDGQAEANPEAMLSPLGESIRSDRKVIERIIRKVDELRRRVEI